MAQQLNLNQNSSEYKSIAIAGASGGLGRIIASEFLKDKSFKVKILTRSQSSNGQKKHDLDALQQQGAQLFWIDYNNRDELIKSLEGVHVIISALNGPALEKEQLALVDAAKAAHVRRFIPSEYGIDHSINLKEPFLEVKRKVQKAIKENGLEYSFFYPGFFLDYFFQPWFGFDLPNKSIKIVGDGAALVSFTHRQDVAKYIMASLKHPEKSKNKEIKLASSTLSFNDAAELIRKSMGSDIKVEHMNKDEVKAKVEKSKYSAETIVEQLQLVSAEGRAIIKSPQNAEYPEVKPIKAEDFFRQMKA